MQTRLGQDADVKNPTYYQMPSDTVSADEWAEFDNVYHIHCPRISMDSAIRDVSHIRSFLLPISDNFLDHDAILLLLQSQERSRIPHGHPVSTNQPK